jgi:hypothetical protein
MQEICKKATPYSLVTTLCAVELWYCLLCFSLPDVECDMNQSEDEIEMRRGRKGVIFGVSRISYYAMRRPGMRWVLLRSELQRIFFHGPSFVTLSFVTCCSFLHSFPLCTSCRSWSARSCASSLDPRLCNIAIQNYICALYRQINFMILVAATHLSKPI